MKKFLSILLLLGITSTAIAQKSYITVVYNQEAASAQLSGDLPEGTESFYYCSISNGTRYNSMGDILNYLAQYGYEVEHMVTQPLTTANKFGIIYLLSRPSSSPTQTRIQKVTTSSDEEIKEVDRYNLQGLPVKKDAKGIQIIVYSNYTTKTVIVE